MMKLLVLFLGVFAALGEASSFWGGDDVCSRNSCWGQSRCVASFTTTARTCECPYGWEGELCDIVSDYATQNREEVPVINDLNSTNFRSSGNQDRQHGAEMSRMTSASAWVAKATTTIDVMIHNKMTSLIGGYREEPVWIQVKLTQIRQIHRVVTKGSPTDPFWITSYKIAHSVDDVSWFMMHDVDTGSETVFPGNTDSNTAVSNHVPGHRETLYVRLYAQTFHGQAALRWEIYGCGFLSCSVITCDADETCFFDDTSNAVCIAVTTEAPMDESDEDDSAVCACVSFLSILFAAASFLCLTE